MFVADDLGAWLIGLLADMGRKKLTAVILGVGAGEGAARGRHGRRVADRDGAAAR